MKVMCTYVTKLDFIIRASMVWAMAERGSTRNGNKDGWSHWLLRNMF